MFQISIDTGGTFTDAVLTDEERGLDVVKFPTDSNHPENSIMGCIKLLASARELEEEALIGRLDTLVIGTTLPTNVLLEEKGAKCGLFYTKGFRDTLELNNTAIPELDIYNAKMDPPKVLIPRSLRWGIEERTIHTGEMITPLNEEDVLAAIREAKKQGVEVPVVCFLHSYANPGNEERAAELIKAEFPDVVISSHILRRWIEFDRTSAASIAAYVKPPVMRLVRELEQRLSAGKFKGNLIFITCLGGVTSPALTIDNPALLLGSGPAGGVLIGRYFAEASGIENIITADMGGTSFDVSVLPERRIVTTTETLIGDYKNAIESINIMSIGAGGGSIAWVDNTGMLRVGPSSAGADPGPACYNKGGRLPTVTDANTILGYCPTDHLMGGTLKLDASLAEKAINDEVAGKLNMNVVDAAYAIVSIVEANMADRIFLSAVENGYSPSKFTLVIGGGAGPIHAVNLAKRLEIGQVYIPKHAGIFSALGMMTADYKHVIPRFFGRTGDDVRVDDLRSVFYALEEEGAETLRCEGIAEDSWQFIRGAEMRYYGQLHHIEFLFPKTERGTEFSERSRDELIQGFHDRHKDIYGWSDSSYPVVVETLKVHAIGKRDSFSMEKKSKIGVDVSAARKRSRQAYFNELGGFIDTACYNGDKLLHGNVLTGPAIIEETNTTLVIPPGAELRVDEYGNYIIMI